METMNPLVSIIISCYNSERFVAATLESVLNQTYNPIEIIIVNDGSLDKSPQILESYVSNGIKVYHRQNKGQDAALNFGFLQSTGKYIKFLDSDDIISPQAIEQQVKALKNNPRKVAYSEWYRFFGALPTAEDEKKKMFYWKDMDAMDFLTLDQDGPMLQCGIMMMHRSIIEKAGLWDERLILYNDTEFFTRILLASEGIAFTPGAKLYYRSGTSTSLSVQQTLKYFESTFLATQLIEKHLLAREDSPRVRRLLANIYFRRRYEMYPRFNDLAKKHVQKIKYFGGSDLKVKGGRLHNLINDTFGWKATILVHSLRNKIRQVIGA